MQSLMVNWYFLHHLLLLQITLRSSFLGGAVITTPYLSADQFGIIRINAAEITQNATISLGYNASSAGPLTVANDVTISVSNGSSWTIL
jgi:hypothetical protein